MHMIKVSSVSFLGSLQSWKNLSVKKYFKETTMIMFITKTKFCDGHGKVSKSKDLLQ